jgi:lipopolysaccharide biosynthesis glycosyltransferase
MPVEKKADTSHDYGIYTIGDDNFFAGIVASINALKYYGYKGPVAVFDIGFEPWMVEYLNEYEHVTVLDIAPVAKHIRFTDLKTDESPIMRGWAYKAFAIVHYNLFQKWTFIDGDYLPLCNLEKELLPLIEAGHIIFSEDGWNTWGIEHEMATGVKPGTYMNVNAGFISLDMEKHGYIVHEWRNLMTRRKPFDLWYGDQGALNVILDKWEVEKTTLDKALWNQTWLNDEMARENHCQLIHDPDDIHVWHGPTNKRIMGWHGAGWYKLWHQAGIDHYRKHDATERERFYKESQGKSPWPLVEIFEYFLFLDQFHTPLKRKGHLIAEMVH